MYWASWAWVHSSNRRSARTQSLHIYIYIYIYNSLSITLIILTLILCSKYKLKPSSQARKTNYDLHLYHMFYVNKMFFNKLSNFFCSFIFTVYICVLTYLVIFFFLKTKLFSFCIQRVKDIGMPWWFWSFFIIRKILFILWLNVEEMSYFVIY